ncbi:Rab-like protein 6 [Hypsibius exemplaris]|uniref:Rab-like protein 6 n=1 Tax=Hypsibius exemplaris TaxID=2072580 RepID=A0A1W0X316_HYPEX|nr:Rab-like protein 6 [Hypsibius exemplaris]
MFSKLRKLVGREDESVKGGDGGDAQVEAGGTAKYNGMRTLQPQLQLKFGRGIQYNMKIIIRGDKNVGKSCLWLRLQGLPFKEEYLPSEEIQVANIQWNFKASDDIVKVEIWDVVDKSKKRRTLSGLKLKNDGHIHANGDGMKADIDDQVGLDAETLDVYKGTHGVIMVMDLTKPWTFDYVKQEMERVPVALPVLILVNHRDMGHHQSTSVNLDQVKSFILHMERPETAAPVIVAESSMRNGFGLKYLHKFFNLPFLKLQREAVERQIEQNKRDVETTFHELESLLESEEQNYEMFIASLEEKRRKEADKLAPAVTPVGRNLPDPASGDVSAAQNTQKRMHAPPAHLPLNGKESPAVSKTQSSTGFFSRKTAPPATAGLVASKPDNIISTKASTPDPVSHIDEFIPGDYVPGEFLEEPSKSPSVAPSSSFAPKLTDGDSSEDDGNPMVAGFTDEVELDEIPSEFLSSFNSVTTRTDVAPKSVIPKLESPKTPGSYPVDSTVSTVVLDSEPSVIVLSAPNTPDVEESLTADEPPDVLEEFNVSHVIPTSPLQFDSNEFSSWLSSVEKRNTEKEVLARRYSAGLVTATSLDDSRIEASSVMDEEQTSAPVPKKTKKKKGTKVSKSEKTSKKSASQPKDAAPTEVQVNATAVKVRSPVKRDSPEVDQQKVLERELEDFLASEDE